MRWLVRSLLVMHLLNPSLAFGASIEARTRDGRTVILSPDATWKYKEEQVSSPSTQAFSKPATASSVLRSQKGFFELWYEPPKWSTRSGLPNPSAEFSLRHSSGDAYSFVIVERIAVPLTVLRDFGLDNVKNQSPDASIVLEEEREVNGVKVLAVQIEATGRGFPDKFYNYYWSGKAGNVQLITFTGQNLFDEYKGNLENLLNGMVVTKP